jgi:hypothetical protein
MLLNYIFSSVLILFYSLVVGLGLTKILKKNFFYFPIFFTTLIGSLSLILFILNIYIWFLFLIPFLMLLLPFYQKIKELKKEETKILLFFIMQFFIYIILQLFIPFYPLGRNWVSYYKSSLNITEGNFQLDIGRNPLFNFIEGAFLNIFGKNFYIAQITTCLIGSLVVFPYFLLSKKILKKKLILFSLFFYIFNPFIIENILYNWARMLTTMFILYFCVFVIEKKYFFSYISAVLGFLSHSISLFFIFPIYLVYTIKKRKIWTKIFILFLLTFLVITIVGKIVEKKYEYEKNIFIFYPFAVNGWEVLANKSTAEIFNDFFSKPLYYHFFVRIVNLANTILPTIPILKLINYFIGLPIVQLHKVIDFSKLPLIYYYYHSIPGALTTGVYIFFVLSAIQKKNRNLILTFMILPLIFEALTFGWIVPGLIKSLQPFIPIAIILSVGKMGKYKKRMMYLAFLVMILEAIFFFYLYYNFISFSIENLKKMGDYETLGIETINRLIFKTSI